MDKDKFKQEMAAYSFGQQQVALQLWDHMTQLGWTIKDLRLIVQEEIKNLQIAAKERKKYVAPARPCPECGLTMRLLSVNTSPSTQTGDLKDRAVWYCENKDCMNTIFIRKTPAQITKEA